MSLDVPTTELERNGGGEDEKHEEVHILRLIVDRVQRREIDDIGVPTVTIERQREIYYASTCVFWLAA